MIASDHIVQVFDVDAQLVDAVSRFIHVGIESDEVCVVIATADHRERFAASLSARGLDIAALESTYRYIVVDSHALLAQFFRNERLDRCRFHDRVGLLMRQAASSGKSVRVFGDMVALPAGKESVSVALELEELWNELGRSQDFVLFCGYSRSSFGDEQEIATFERVCALHTHSAHSLPGRPH